MNNRVRYRLKLRDLEKYDETIICSTINGYKLSMLSTSRILSCQIREQLPSLEKFQAGLLSMQCVFFDWSNKAYFYCFFAGFWRNALTGLWWQKY